MQLLELIKPKPKEIFPYLAFPKLDRVCKKESRLEELLLTTLKESISIEEKVTLRQSISQATSGLDKQNIPQLATIRYDAFIQSSSVQYSVLEIEYAVAKEKETLSVKVKKDEYLSATVEKPRKQEREYTMRITYDTQKQGYHLQYETKEYTDRIDLARQDFRLALDKHLEIIPKSLMGGVLGFTYLGSGKIARRSDLFGSMAMMVDVHESIHTPDEYETRVLTDWILAVKKPEYKR